MAYSCTLHTQAVVSSLSGGPVFPCDEIGTSDVALIMRSCNTDGLLLQVKTR
jgi:hypothetical protein